MAKFNEDEITILAEEIKERLPVYYKNLYKLIIESNNEEAMLDIIKMEGELVTHIIQDIRYHGCTIDDFYPVERNFKLN